MLSYDNGHLSTDLLTVGQVAAWLNIHPNTVRRWVQKGDLDAYRIGSRGDRRIRRGDVEHLLDGDPRRKRSSKVRRRSLQPAPAD